MAKEGRRIVVAVDGGEESLYALSWCLKNLVAAVGAEGEEEDTVILVHAAAPPTTYAVMDGTGYFFSTDMIATMDQYNNEVAAAVVTRAKSLCADYPHIKVETVVGSGDPREVICEAVKKKGADLLVMGSHGYNLIQRALLGSVSNHCVHHAKCPCLIVKKPRH